MGTEGAVGTAAQIPSAEMPPATTLIVFTAQFIRRLAQLLGIVAQVLRAPQFPVILSFTLSLSMAAIAFARIAPAAIVGACIQDALDAGRENSAGPLENIGSSGGTGARNASLPVRIFLPSFEERSLTPWFQVKYFYPTYHPWLPRSA